MKLSVMKEVTVCDACEKEAYVTECLCCGTGHCYDCRKTHGTSYAHAVNVSGSGDGYYCAECDFKLTREGTNLVHRAYRAIKSLRNELTAWGEDFNTRKNAAEQHLKSLIK